MGAVVLDVTANKDIGKTGGAVLDMKARKLYGSAVLDENGDWDSGSGRCFGVSWMGGSDAMTKIHLANDDQAADKAAAETLLEDLEIPTCEAAVLAITTNVGQLIVDDVYNVTADPSDTKFVKMVLGLDDATGDLELFALEKTTGEYDNLPGGKTFVADLKEFSVEAAGTDLVEVADYI